MSRVVIGIDPDSQAHGIAVYDGGVLTICGRATTIEIVEKHIKPYRLKEAQVLFAIEDVLANKSIYSRNDQDNKKKQGAVGQSIGKCKQAQIELVRWLDHYKMPYKLFPPQKGNWGATKNKPQFEAVTGWKKSSNADGRSAAFFGFLALKNVKKITPMPTVPKF